MTTARDRLVDRHECGRHGHIKARWQGDDGSCLLCESDKVLVDRLVAVIEAMPDFAGRTAREDGLTHRCSKCDEWVAEADVERDPTWRGRVHMVRGRGRHGEWIAVPCGPVSDLSPVEGVLRADVIATLRQAAEESTT